MESINLWIVEINKTNPILMGIITVVTMAGMGAGIAYGIELIFKILGIKGERIEIHH